MEWIFKYDPNHLNDEERQPLAIDKYYTLEEGEVTALSYDHYFKEIIVGTRDGMINVLPLIADTNNVNRNFFEI